MAALNGDKMLYCNILRSVFLLTCTGIYANTHLIPPSLYLDIGVKVVLFCRKPVYKMK